jgi:hypothetical protein
VLTFTDMTQLSVRPCHHEMALPRFADRGDVLQMRRVAENILNKQLRIAEEG